jgi:hypothetical protein
MGAPNVDGRNMSKQQMEIRRLTRGVMIDKVVLRERAWPNLYDSSSKKQYRCAELTMLCEGE